MLKPRSILSLAVLLTAACTEAPPPRPGEPLVADGRWKGCGNGHCTKKETCETCPRDCGECTPRVDSGPVASDLAPMPDAGAADSSSPAPDTSSTADLSAPSPDIGPPDQSAPDSAGPTAYRAFTSGSYWNTPMPANAPLDPNSATYIAYAMDPSVSTGFLRLTGAPDHSAGDAWSYPIYWASSTDPLYTIDPSKWGPTVEMRIPYGATPQSGSDGAIIVYDLGANRVFELWQASYDGGSDRWSASSTKRYVLDSNGLSGKVAGSDNPLNKGHRGLPPPIRAIRVDEVQSGAINRRLECFWHATGRPDDSAPWYYWPMSGYESGKGGITPEGLVLRIKPSVDLTKKGLSPAALVIATAMKEYGCVIGDNEGSIKNSLKLERDKAGWKALDPDLTLNALSVLSWADYEFIKGGYQP